MVHKVSKRLAGTRAAGADASRKRFASVLLRPDGDSARAKREAQLRYENKYNHSPKGKSRNAKYRLGTAYRAAQARYRATPAYKLMQVLRYPGRKLQMALYQQERKWKLR